MIDDKPYYGILEIFAKENNSNGGDDDSKRNKIKILVVDLFRIVISKEEEDKILTLVKNGHFIKLMNDVKQESGWRPEVVKFMKNPPFVTRLKNELYEEYRKY